MLEGPSSGRDAYGRHGRLTGGGPIVALEESQERSMATVKGGFLLMHDGHDGQTQPGARGTW